MRRKPWNCWLTFMQHLDQPGIPCKEGVVCAQNIMNALSGRIFCHQPNDENHFERQNQIFVIVHFIFSVMQCTTIVITTKKWKTNFD